jgi:recombinational DNA repair protein (RecF pathway)
MSQQTVKCRICGKPYHVYMYYSGDQSACPSCIQQAEEQMNNNPITDFNEIKVDNQNKEVV